MYVHTFRWGTLSEKSFNESYIILESSFSKEYKYTLNTCLFTFLPYFETSKTISIQNKTLIQFLTFNKKSFVKMFRNYIEIVYIYSTAWRVHIWRM